MGEVAAVPGSAGRRSDGSGEERVFGVGQLERPFRPARRLVPDPQVGELGKRGDQPQGEIGVPVGDGALERGAEVVVVGQHPVHPASFVGPLHGASALLGERGEVAGVPPCDAVDQTRLGEPLAAERAQRLQDQVARAARRVVGDHHRLVDEPDQQVEGVVLAAPGVGADAVGGVEVEPAREGRQPGEQCPLRFGEQAVRPVDRGDEALVPRHPTARRVHQARAVEALRELRRRHRADAGRRELDREGEPVEPATDLAHRLRAVVIEGELRPVRPGTVGEQRRRVDVGQRVHRDHPLALDPERFPARRQHLHRRAVPDDPVDDPGGGIQDVLAVVHDEQEAPTVEVARDRLLDAVALLLLHAERGGHGVAHGGTVGQPGELAQPHPVGEPVPGPARSLDGEPGLADPTDPGERDQRAVAHGVDDLADVLAPAEETRRAALEVAASPAGGGEHEGGVGLQDLLLHPAQLRPRFATQLLDEAVPDPLVGGERIGLPPAAVLGEHQLPGQPLVEGMSAGLCGDLAEELGVPAGLEGRVVAVQRGGEPLGQERGAQVREPRHVGHREGVAPPQVEGLREEGGRIRRTFRGRARETRCRNRCRSTVSGSAASR
ncbi:hypothetical protein BJF90_06210 [Pseudonocardia sp. CNS-004]|nr:hypothetical protein BJF90_06210 [Pseudonocardia sp. CNS-004]